MTDTDSVEACAFDGYTADTEHETSSDSTEDTVSSDERSIARKRRRPPSLNHDQRRRRQFHRECNTSGSTSLSVQSKFLEHYFESTQQQVPEQQNDLQASCIHTTLPLSSLSLRCISIEDSLAFTSLPRILIEAKPPYHVVHTNAAYARLRGQETPCFGPCDLLTMYPVLGSDCHADPHVTHYLVEGNDPKTTLPEQHKRAIG
jgi:hypothetical protein